MPSFQHNEELWPGFLLEGKEEAKAGLAVPYEWGIVG